jgi:argininosuccinate lyase
LCVEKRCELQDLTLEELHALSPAIASDIYGHLRLENVLACHDVQGGTAPKHVKRALQAARDQLAVLRETHATHA